MAELPVDPNELLDRSLLIQPVSWWGEWLNCYAVIMRVEPDGRECEAFRGNDIACRYFVAALRPVVRAFMVEARERSDQCRALELAKLESIELHRPGMVVFRHEHPEACNELMAAIRSIVAGSSDYDGTLMLVVPHDVEVESLDEACMEAAGWVRSAS